MQLLQEGHVWVVDADLKSYFDTIPHERLMELVEERDRRWRRARTDRSFLKQGVMEALQH